MASIDIEEKLSENGIATFVSELAKYYMDFLETDFHKRRAPKRSVKYHNSKNLRIGLNLSKYSTFESLILKVLENDLQEPITISRGKFRAEVSQNTKNLITAQIKSISDDTVMKIVADIATSITDLANPETAELTDAIVHSLDFASDQIRQDAVNPFVKSIETILQKTNATDVDLIFDLEESLLSILTDPLEELITEWIENHYSGNTDNIADQIQQVFDGDFVRTSIESYFSNFSLNDLYFEIQELVDNNLILDKQDIYLYFCDIHFLNEKYPLFYIPLTIKQLDRTFQVICEPSVYINKKAIEYVVQEFNKERERQGTIKSISERIIYPQDHQSSITNVLDSIVSEIVDYFQLPSELDISDRLHRTVKGLSVAVANSLYICIFDKSDEALINDYEEILELMKSEDADLVGSFMELINDFVGSNLKPFKREVEDEWDKTPLEKKLVYSSPIPLNPEQRQILKALENPHCKYIAVEGPPGTGKSHTITAIVFQAVLQNHSVLVLSDKKEALDVVEEKINDVMNRVRLPNEPDNHKFSNPILRLGKSANNYSKILSTSSVEKVRMYARAMKSKKSDLNAGICNLEKALTSNIHTVVTSYEKINIDDIRKLVEFDCQYNMGNDYPIDFAEIWQSENGAHTVDKVWNSMLVLRNTIEYPMNGLTLLGLFGTLGKNDNEANTFSTFLSFAKVIQELRKTYQHLSILRAFRTITDEQVAELNRLIVKYRVLGSGFFGYFLKGKTVAQLSQTLNGVMSLNSPIDLKRDYKELVSVTEFWGNANLALKIQNMSSFLADPLPIIHQLMIPENHLLDKIDLDALIDHIDIVSSYIQEFPISADISGISPLNTISYFQNKLCDISEEEHDDMVSHLCLHRRLFNTFHEIPEFDHSGYLLDYQEQLTTQMTHNLDEKLLDFIDNDQNTAKTLRGIIKKKQRFPKPEFKKLKEAFPCIIAGIRDYAEYIPLEPDIFDVVIIDEASQVSIAQAFPALLRAKQVVVLGDRKQFSNVKTALARSDMNSEYVNRLEISFKKNISTGEAELERLTKFNIKTSILEFFEFIANYNIMLRKHFRGYRELISYSSKHFYDGELQAIRIREKSIKETIRFSFIDHDGKQELAKNTNTLECNFILEQLRHMKEEGNTSSVGVITPHTNQQKLIASAISNDIDRDYFYNRMKLKIMTFDTCQGEERDIIFYSMVATPNDDKLWGIFIKDLDSVDLEECGQIKAQRLNVGFSRAKECMHFVLSKPIDKYTGSIGQALRHYSVMLRGANKLPEAENVDSRSPMEAKVLEWIKNTPYFQNNSSSIELKAQFPIGEYLKQLDPYYNHPAYRVDFLLLCRDDGGNQHSIIIEYDGFNEHFGHFTQNVDVNEYNYDNYYTVDHVEREKVLEGYGYKFLRINRFNLGEDPVSTLNKRFLDLTRPKPKHVVLNRVHELVESQATGQSKVCPKCGKLKPVSEFADNNLKSGMGRYCNVCKNKKQKQAAPALKNRSEDLANPRSKHKICPKCGSPMVPRRGKFGTFYGCSRYPKCHGTRKRF